MDGGDASSPPGAVDRSVTVSGSSVELVQHTVYVLQCRVDEERQRYMTGNIGPGQGHGRSGPGRY